MKRLMFFIFVLSLLSVKGYAEEEVVVPDRPEVTIPDEPTISDLTPTSQPTNECSEGCKDDAPQ